MLQIATLVLLQPGTSQKPVTTVGIILKIITYEQFIR